MSPEGNAARTAATAPIGERAVVARPYQRAVPPSRPSAGHRSWDRTRDACMRMQRVFQLDMRRTSPAESRAQAGRTSNRPQTHLPRSMAVLAPRQHADPGTWDSIRL